MVRRKKKPGLPATALDAIIVAVSPALIIGMVSCLVFFLVAAFYRGQYDQRLIYILGLYTLATVLIARIAIESGRSYAMAFSVPLALATILAMSRYVRIDGVQPLLGWIINVGMLAVAWFLADRITHDCTLLDERDSGVRQGLLQSLGLMRNEHWHDTDASAEPSKERVQSAAKQAVDGSQPKAKRRKKHNPGVWVLYFSLLALPLFGFGQLLIPTESDRNQAFMFLVGYLACGLALLMTTSFVAMRRYVRHRGVAMPAELSRKWLSYGATGIVIVLLACLILPLPGRSMGLIGFPFDVKLLEALNPSRYGWGGEGTSEEPSSQQAGDPQRNAQAARVTDPEADENQPQGDAASPDGQGSPQASEQADDDGPQSPNDGGKSKDRGSDDKAKAGNDQPSNPSETRQDKPNAENQPDKAGQKSPENAQQKPQPDKQPSGDRRPGSDKQPEKNKQTGNNAKPKAEGQPPKQAPPENPQSPPPTNASNWQMPSSLGAIFKWITVAVLAVFVIGYALTHPQEIARMWQAWLAWLGSLFGNDSQTRPTEAATKAGAIRHTAPPRRFDSFANPFQASQSWTPELVIETSFAALEAWAAENGIRRGPEQTAAEFAMQLGARIPTIKDQSLAAALMLDRLMFSDWKPARGEVLGLASLWQQMQTRHA